MGEPEWRHRCEAELQHMQVVALGDDRDYLRLRFDGFEYEPDSGFLDVTVWASRPAPWKALFVGNFESHAVIDLAGFLLDVTQGWNERDSIKCSVEPGGFELSARRESDDRVTVDVFGGGADVAHLVEGRPAVAPISVPLQDVLDAVLSLIEESTRFTPDVARSGWVPEDPAHRGIEDIVPLRRALLDAEPRTVDEAVDQLRGKFARTLADPATSEVERRMVEFLSGRLEQSWDEDGPGDKASSVEQRYRADGQEVD